MSPSTANMHGCYIVAFALQGITSCRVFVAKAMLISNFVNPGKVPYYVIGPAKSTKSLYWMEHFRSDINSRLSGLTIIMDTFTKSELQSPFTASLFA